ncbi:MAG: regulatory protein RecX [Rhodanobacteraceae bacterium]
MAYQKALGLLARREHSERELCAKLAARGAADDEVTDAIARLQERGFQSNARFAEVLARSRASQGYGPARIRAELKSHAIDDKAIQGALAALDVDWSVSARAQLRRRQGAKSRLDAAERARRARFLLRRGFDAATVRAVTRADIDDPDD